MGDRLRRGYTRKRRRDQVACLIAVFGGKHSGARCSCGPSGVDCRCRLGAIGWVWALESDPARRGRYIASHDVTGARHRTRGSPPGVHRPRVAQTPDAVGRGDRVSPHFRPDGENVLGTYGNTCAGRSPGRILCWHVSPRTRRLALFVVGSPGSARAMRHGSRGVPWFNTASVLLARLGNLRGNLRSRLRLPSMPPGAMPALVRTAQVWVGPIPTDPSAIGDDVHAEGAPTPCNRARDTGRTCSPQADDGHAPRADPRNGRLLEHPPPRPGNGSGGRHAYRGVSFPPHAGFRGPCAVVPAVGRSLAHPRQRKGLMHHQWGVRIPLAKVPGVARDFRQGLREGYRPATATAPEGGQPVRLCALSTDSPCVR